MKPHRVRGLDAKASVAVNAARIVRVRTAELYSFDPAVLDPARITELHDMRIAAKRLRYVLEITGHCFGAIGDEAEEFAKDLQGTIGEIHDCDVLIPRVDREIEALRAQDAEGPRAALPRRRRASGRAAPRARPYALPRARDARGRAQRAPGVALRRLSGSLASGEGRSPSFAPRGGVEASRSTRSRTQPTWRGAPLPTPGRHRPPSSRAARAASQGAARPVDVPGDEHDQQPRAPVVHVTAPAYRQRGVLLAVTKQQTRHGHRDHHPSVIAAFSFCPALKRPFGGAGSPVTKRLELL